MREGLTAWAGDCTVRGEVDLGEGRLSDQVNELDLLTFHNAVLHAIDDGHEVEVDEIEVERRELYVIQVEGRRGDPARRQRTVRERVMLRIGPYLVTGNLHRSPASQSLAAVAGWSRFVPVTEAEVGIQGREEPPVHQDVVLVNRERISRTDRLDEVAVYDSGPWPPLPVEEPGQA